ncbi:ABC transporter ATP-binding protein [Halobellus salinisoli]|uniref:ABC transporter ATP-binding protein n=1 Tax=Halobellus salinisoli TaxID=3108500 RepID=UPI00300AC030
MTEPLLEIENLRINYEARNDDLRAVSDVSFTIDQNEYFGLVGESGSGKSTIAKSVIGGLDSNGEVVSGTVKYKGREIQDFSEDQYSDEIRWKEIAVIPQAAMNSLDPLMKVQDQAVELAQRHTDWTEHRAVERLYELFEVVGLPTSRIDDYPHQFSGGMKQRAIIALALLLDPDLIIADEPTTALDVIMQDQILKYIQEIKGEGDLGMLMITHDISVIFEQCDAMGVLHAGQLAEVGDVMDVFNSPRHPYALLLQQAFPDVRYPDRELEVIKGNPPALREEVNYCTFADRCPWAEPECHQSAPPLEGLSDDPDHKTSCFRSDELVDLAEEYFTKDDRVQIEQGGGN